MPPDRQIRGPRDPWWRPAPASMYAAPFDGADSGMAIDQELEPLAAELTTAGARARVVGSGGRAKVDPVFAAALRARLLSTLPSGRTVRSDEGDLPAAAGHGVRSAGADELPAVAAGEPRSMTSSSAVAERAPAAVAPVPSGPVRLAPGLARASRPTSATRRWGVLVVAAALIVAVVGLETGRLFPGRLAARASDAVGARLIRAGTEGPLLAGAQLQDGDLVHVSQGGHALLDLAAGQARLASGASVRLVAVTSDRIELDQVAGRVYHRVAMASGGRYVVRTAELTWTALGTAFDLDRRALADVADAASGEIIRELSLQHEVRVEGAGLAATIAEGRSALVRLSGGSADMEVRSVASSDLADPWLLANTLRDREAGLPLGVLADVARLLATIPPPSPTSAAPSVTLIPATAETPSGQAPTPAASTAATAPTPSPRATVKTTAAPKSSPTPTPAATSKPASTPTAAPTSTPAPTLGSLSLSLTPCEGGFVVASWSKWLGSGFNHYRGLRAATSSIPATYPPGAGVSAPAGLYTSTQTTITGLDAGLSPGSTYWYRAVAFDAAEQALAASSALSTVAKASKPLGALSIETTGPASTTFAWSPYPGIGTCFTYYKLVYSASDPSPSYLKGSSYVWAGSTKTDASATIDGIAPGTYWFKLEALRSTGPGHVLVAATDVASFTIP